MQEPELHAACPAATLNIPPVDVLSALFMVLTDVSPTCDTALPKMALGLQGVSKPILDFSGLTFSSNYKEAIQWHECMPAEGASHALSAPTGNRPRRGP